MIVLLVAAGAAIGAPARYLTDRAISRHVRSDLPWGTFAVNLVASFVLGAVTGVAGQLSTGTQALIGTGFCGALSTFSTFSYEVLALTRSDRVGAAMLTAVGGVLGAVLAAALGWVFGASV